VSLSLAGDRFAFGAFITELAQHIRFGGSHVEITPAQAFRQGE
jgi:hypothetical protein